MERHQAPSVRLDHVYCLKGNIIKNKFQFNKRDLFNYYIKSVLLYLILKYDLIDCSKIVKVTAMFFLVERFIKLSLLGHF